jgi:competence ComEA-like helix-hairpin-helix protein
MRFSANATRERRIGFSAAVCLLLLLIGGLLACAEPKKHPPAEPLDLNTATAEELQQLPGVGPGMAKAIVDFRQKGGPFRRVEDLLAIRGITKQRLEKIRPNVKIVPPDSRKPS